MDKRRRFHAKSLSLLSKRGTDLARKTMYNQALVIDQMKIDMVKQPTKADAETSTYLGFKYTESKDAMRNSLPIARHLPKIKNKQK